jgi:predicted ATP-dependent endonuclease of OLD family
MLFADHVILVEGAEEHVLPQLASVYFKEPWLNRHNVTIARAEGKDSFRAYVDILDQFDIGWTIMTDLDFLQRGVTEFLDIIDVADFAKRRDEFLNLAKNLSDKPEIKESVMKEALKRKDGATLYARIEEVVSSLSAGSHIEESSIETINSVWHNLKDFIEKFSLKVVVQDYKSTLEPALISLLSNAEQAGVFILDNGELEDVYQSVPPGTKEIKAVSIADALKSVSDWKYVSRVIKNPEFFVRLFDRVKQRCEHVPRDRGCDHQ